MNLVEKILLEAIREGTVRGVESFQQEILAENEFLSLLEETQLSVEEIIENQFSQVLEEACKTRKKKQDKNKKKDEQEEIDFEEEFEEEFEEAEDELDRLIKEAAKE